MDVRDLLLYILWDIEHFASTDHLRASIDVSEERMSALGQETKQSVWGLCTYLFHRLPNYTSELVINTLAACSSYPLDKMPADGDVTNRRFVLEFACWVIRKVAPIEVTASTSTSASASASASATASAPASAPASATASTTGGGDETAPGGVAKKRRVTVREGDD